ncbi:hypothetical protein B0H14DRAFT_3430878 [Mycena olivaceomarginata]|nr:hypothetical protein B0H14DRAFT_3430878 [Mycena olivaceomarginata]
MESVPRSRVSLSTLNYKLLRRTDFIDLSHKTSANVHFQTQTGPGSGAQIQYHMQGKERLPFPSYTRGFLYWTNEDELHSPLAGSLRFRITHSADPKSFESGRDLTRRSNRDWKIIKAQLHELFPPPLTIDPHTLVLWSALLRLEHAGHRVLLLCAVRLMRPLVMNAPTDDIVPLTEGDLVMIRHNAEVNVVPGLTVRAGALKNDRISPTNDQPTSVELHLALYSVILPQTAVMDERPGLNKQPLLLHSVVFNLIFSQISIADQVELGATQVVTQTETYIDVRDMFDEKQNDTDRKGGANYIGTNKSNDESSVWFSAK